MNKTIVKINSCADDNYWYKNKVGNSFELIEGAEIIDEGNTWRLHKEGAILDKFINKKDCEIIRNERCTHD